MADSDAEWWPSEGFTRLIGIEDYELGPGGDGTEVTARISVEDQHHNIGGIVHGGVLTTLLDSVMGAAVVRTLDEDEWCATEALHTEFMRPATGRLTAVGRVDRRGRLTAFVSGEVAREDGKTVARATGVWAIRKG